MRALLLAILFTCLVSCSQETKEESSAARWEYKIVTASEMVAALNKNDIDLVWNEKSMEPYQSIQDFLNKLGADGWQLVSLGQAKEWGFGAKGMNEKFSPDGSLRGVPFVFKRMVEATR